jgi:hypothetical protein
MDIVDADVLLISHHVDSNIDKKALLPQHAVVFVCPFICDRMWWSSRQ